MNNRMMRALALLPLAWACAATAQTLPPPPVSPAPVVNYEYDAEGNPTKQIQAPGVTGFGFTTSHTYDNLHRRKDTTNAKAGKIQFAYDGLDRTTQVTDPRNLVTQYPRTGLGEATQLISPDTGTTGYTYDAAGNLKTATDARGVTVTYSYDALNRLTQAVYTQSGQATRTYGWTYDQNGGGFGHGIGRLTSTAFVGGTQAYQYDAQGRITAATQNVFALSGANPATVSHTTGYAYTAAGQLQRITYPSGRVVEYTYTNAQLSAIGLKPNTTGAAQSLLSNIVYSPFGPPVSWNWQLNSGPQAHQRVYDTYGRLVRYRLGGAWRDITYDAANRITRFTHYLSATGAAVPSLDQSFGYDELGRLTSVATASASWSFSYDANGNRTQHVLNGTAVPYTISSTSNRLTQVNASPVRSVSHDAVGNTVSDTFTATYSLENRLRSLTKAGMTTTYTYNSDGLRVRKFSSTGASSTRVFVYDLNGQLLGEYDQAGNAIKEYVWLGSTPVAVFTPDPANAANPPIAYYIHTDHLDTPRMVMDRNDKRRWRWLAEPFGTTAPENNPDNLGPFTFNLRFPGQYFDQESGLYYNWHRDYDATTGRYVQSDPIGLQGGINTYVYVSGSPVSYVDPTGLLGCRVVGLAIVCDVGPPAWSDPDWPARPPVSVPPIPANIVSDMCRALPFVCASIMVSRVISRTHNTAANDDQYCPPDDFCKREQERLQLERNQLIDFGGMIRPMNDQASLIELRNAIVAFNREVDAHNRMCPAYPVLKLALP